MIVKSPQDYRHLFSLAVIAFAMIAGIRAASAEERGEQFLRTVVQRGITESPNDGGQRFFAASADGRVLLLGWAWELWAYDLASRKILHRAPLTGGQNWRATIDPTGRYFLIARNMGHGWHPFVVHDLATGREHLADPDENDRAEIAAARFDPDDQRIFSFEFEQVTIRDPDNGRTTVLPLEQKIAGQDELEVKIDSRLSLRWDGRNSLFLLHGNQVADRLSLEGVSGLSPLTSCGGHYASADRLLVYGTDGKEVLVFDVFQHQLLLRTSGSFFCVDPDSNRMAIQKKDGKVQIYELLGGEKPVGSASGSLPMILSKGGKFLATWDADSKTIRHHDLANGRVEELDWPCEDAAFGRPLSLAYNVDGSQLAAAGSHVCDVSPRIFGTASGRVQKVVENTMTPAAFDSATGRFHFTVFDSHTTMSLTRLSPAMDRRVDTPGQISIVPNSYAITGLSFDDNSRFHVANGWDGDSGAALVSYSMDSRGKLAERFRIPGHFSGPITISAGRGIVAQTAGGVLVFDPANPDDLSKQIHLHLFSDGSLAAINGRGEYFAKPDVVKMLGFALGNRAYSFEQFDLPLNRPARIFEALLAPPGKIAALTAWRRERLRRMGHEPEQEVDTSRVPLCEIVERENIPLSSSEKRLPVQVRISTPQQQSVSELQCYVNNVPTQRIAIQPVRSTTAHFDVDVQLGLGRNKIEISAFSEDGIESVRSVVYCHADYAAERPPRLFVLAIGVSDYADDSLDLNVAHKDAEDLARAITKSGGPHFDEVRVKTLLNRAATRESIAAAGNFLRQAGVNDQVIVFFAGHGFQDENDLSYWFGTSDIDPVRFQDRGLPFWEIESLFHGLESRQRLLLMDTCFAGEGYDIEKLSAEADRLRRAGVRVDALASANRRPTQGDGAEFQQLGAFDGAGLFADLRRSTGATVLTATGGVQFVYALENEQLGNGVFTHVFLDGLQNLAADANGDGIVLASEMDDYLVTRVRQMTGGHQETSRRGVNLETDLAIASRINPDEDASPMPPAEPSDALVAGRWEVVEQVSVSNGGYRIVWDYEIFPSSEAGVFGIGFKREIDGRAANASEKLAVSMLQLKRTDDGRLLGLGRESNGRDRQFSIVLEGSFANDRRSFTVRAMDAASNELSATISGRLLEATPTRPNNPATVDGEWTVRELVFPKNGGWNIEWRYDLQASKSAIEGQGRKVRVNGKTATRGESLTRSTILLQHREGPGYQLSGTAEERNHRGHVLRSILQGAISMDGACFLLENIVGDDTMGWLIGWRN